MSCVLPLISVIYTTYEAYAGILAIARIFGLSAVLFFVPSVLIGAVSPLIVKLSLHRLQDTGRSVGSLYALANLGSIAGVFTSGFLLISSFGALWVVLGVGATLIALAILGGELYRFPRTLGLMVAPLGGMLLLVNATGAVQGACDRESQYYCIRWWDDDEMERNRTLRVLALDHLQHSFNNLSNPLFLHYGYLKVYAELTDTVAQRKPAFNALFIGGGGYTMPRYLELTYPEAAIDVIEIDPAVTEVMGALLDHHARRDSLTGRMHARSCDRQAEPG